MRSQIIEQLANMKGNMLSKFSMPANWVYAPGDLRQQTATGMCDLSMCIPGIGILLLH